MHSLTQNEVLELHHLLLARSGGSPGIRDAGGLAAALAQPFLTFDGVELYPTLVDKAAALGFFLIGNHAFVDGNKRIGHAVMETFLVMNGYEIAAETDEQEQTVLMLAAGQMERDEFTEWLKSRVRPVKTNVISEEA